MARRLFGTNGVRGVVGEDMTRDLAVRLGKAYGSTLDAGATVAIGMDARTSSPMLAAAVAEGLQSTGIDVVELGVSPSPGIQFYVKTHDDVRGGVIITASHNPPEFNGIKLVAADGTETSMAEEEIVEGRYFSEEFRRVDSDAAGGRRDEGSANRAYLQAILARVDADAIKKARLKVAIDPAGGPGALVSPQLLKDLGCEVLAINDELDGVFSKRPSEPVEKNLSTLIQHVKEQGADLGVAHDGDADRCVFIDERGMYVSGDQSFAIVARHEVEKAGGGVFCTPISTSNLVREVVDEAGGQYVETAVGSPIVARRMLESDAVFGGEENGGLIFPRMQHCRDGAMSLAVMLEILATTRKPLGGLVGELPAYFTVKEKFGCPNDQKQSLIERLIAQHEDAKDAEVSTVDGLKITFPDGAWVLVRPSGTEPIFRVYTESKDKDRAKALSDAMLEKATDLLPSTAKAS